MARTVSRVTLPDASAGMRPSMRVVASRSRDTPIRLPPDRSTDRSTMLSSRMRSAHPARSASRTSSSVRVSTSMRAGNPCSRRWRSADRSACATPPAAAMWFSLMRNMSYRPRRWFVPPPNRTAHLSSRRRPGAVLRVSIICTGNPLTASTNRCVRVAMPLMRCMRFRTRRSATSRPRAGPWAIPNGAPARMAPPSSPCQEHRMRSSTVEKTYSAIARPASNPSSLGRNCPSASTVSSTTASVVMSPEPTSSASASLTNLRNASSEI